MSSYIRSIRSIERSPHYSPIQPVNRYAQFNAVREAADGGRIAPTEGWDKGYAEAAGGAAEWLALSKRAVKQLTEMQRDLGGREGIQHPGEVAGQLQRLSASIAEWESAYARQRTFLREEIWEVMELALRHPAVKKLGLHHSARSGDSAERTELLSDTEGLKRLLLGADGLLNELKTALSYAEQQYPVDLLKVPFHAAYPYALYYGASQSYWPLPLRGVVLNKSI
ncbi:hypothetical protein ACX93W_11250 [Paenibacillus sp. CAU 1782]